MGSELQVNLLPNQTILLGTFELHPKGLTVRGKPTFEEWESMGKWLRQCEGAVHFWLGDWLKYGETAYGERYAQAMGETGYSYSTLATDVWVAGKIDSSRRRENLSWSHHREVADLAPDEQAYWLERASRGDEGEAWTQRELRQAVREYKHEKRLQAQAPVELAEDAAIHLGDCREILRDYHGLCDLVIADPDSATTSQDVTRHDHSHVQADKALRGSKGMGRLDDIKAGYVEWLSLVFGALRAEGTVMVFGQRESAYLLGGAIMELGYDIVGEIVWSKPYTPSGTGGLLVPAHETIIWARKGDKHECHLRDFTRDVWEVPVRSHYHHPEEKPEALIERLINMATEPGQLVMDPFLGSGVVTAMAKRLKRLYAGIEIDEYWWRVACERTRKG